MPRVNFEDRWWTDPRRSALIKITGSEEFADGLVAKLWRVSQEHWAAGSLIPFRMFRLMPHCLGLIDVGLVRVHMENNPDSEEFPNVPEQDPNTRRTELEQSFVYCSGAVELLSWVAEKREKARVAGLRSAEVRRTRSGSAQPSPRTPAEHDSNDARTDVRTFPNDAEPSGSGSGSGSFIEEEGNEKHFDPIPELEAVANPFLSQVHPDVQKSWVSNFADAKWVRVQIRDATLWLTENPNKRKKNLARFFGGWLRRADKQRQQPAAASGARPPVGRGQKATIDRLASQWDRVEKGEL